MSPDESNQTLEQFGLLQILNYLLKTSSGPGEEIDVHLAASEVNWTNGEVLRLVDEVRYHMPKGSHSLPYDHVAIDWDRVGEKLYYSSDICRAKWLELSNCVRTYRTMKEILTDMQTQHTKWHNKKLNSASKPRVQKDNPDYPKKPVSNGYTLFCQKSIAELKQYKVVDKFRMLGKMWKELPENEKEKFSLNAQVENENYINKVRDYAKEHPDDNKALELLVELESKQKRRNNKLKSASRLKNDHPDYPKKPVSNGYTLFCQKSLAEVKQYKSVDKIRMLGKMWKELPENEKEKFNLDAQVENENYLNKVREYAKEHPDDTKAQELLVKLASKRSSNKRRRSIPRKCKVTTNNMPNGIDTTGPVDTYGGDDDDDDDDDDDQSHLKPPTKKQKLSPKKKSKPDRTGESLYIETKIESSREKHPERDEQCLLEKLKRKYARMSDRKKAKWEARVNYSES